MSCYDEEFYHEPSEFEQQVDELKEALMNSVKDEFKAKMDQLKKENAELQVIKTNFEEIKRDYENKKRQLDWDRQDLERTVRRERVSELMKDLQVELYTVASKGRRNPKCNKCDDNRRIPYTTPLGNETYESCDCSRTIHLYEPVPIALYSFSIRNGEGNAWYKLDGDKRDEYLSYYGDSINGKELITSEEQFESIGYSYKTLFKDKEIAQKYCDYKNKE
ncbi:hypothetical protein CN448_18845 [Bacillus cereus]|uniref:hypothetical protein n=1 Tax=Bacillus cereus TaxID=1396 RepID=UPI000BF672BD|nr:hypothetical protein [Bacillus cereus]PEW66989.1 hypothetical protein CN448_18845 [Bacillus cereus]